MTAVKGGVAPFRPRARLIRLLGDELISDEVMALVELVKNAYDADARTVQVGIFGLSNPSVSSIVVRDDGDGMELDTVLFDWLEPGTDRKRRGGKKRRTVLGRYPLGEKGVGRFAAGKLGTDLELVTRTRGGELETRVTVHWDHFAESEYLDEVENHWQTQLPNDFGGTSHGTLLKIRRLGSQWDATLVERVRDGLTRLVSPFSGLRDFSITLECPEFPQLSGPVVGRLLEHAPYRLVGKVDKHGTLHTTEPTASEFDLREDDQRQFQTETGLRDPLCGPFTVSVYVWDLDSVGLRRASIDRGLRQDLRRTSGVSLYRDGFRVWPYGSPGDDWLELNQRRVNNPTMRVSTNQLVGIVGITDEENPDLRDRTSREGLIDTAAFHDLRSLVLAAISRLEEIRFAARQQGNLQPAAEEESDPVLALVKRARQQSGVGSPQLLSQLEETYRQQRSVHREREERLLKLAGTGLAVDELARAVNRTTGSTRTALRIITGTLQRHTEITNITNHLKLLETSFDLLDKQAEAIESLHEYVSPSEEVGFADVRGTVLQARTIFDYRLQDGAIAFELIPPSEMRRTRVVTNGRLLDNASWPIARIQRGHLLHVLLCLFENAVESLNYSRQSTGKAIQVHLFDNPVSLVFCDSGPGVEKSVQELIFRPFFSRRAEGKGLGLYICREILNRYGYSISLLGKPAGLTGANFQVILEKTQ